MVLSSSQRASVVSVLHLSCLLTKTSMEKKSHISRRWAAGDSSQGTSPPQGATGVTAASKVRTNPDWVPPDHEAMGALLSKLVEPRDIGIRARDYQE